MCHCARFLSLISLRSFITARFSLCDLTPVCHRAPFPSDLTTMFHRACFPSLISQRCFILCVFPLISRFILHTFFLSVISQRCFILCVFPLISRFILHTFSLSVISQRCFILCVFPLCDLTPMFSLCECEQLVWMVLTPVYCLASFSRNEIVYHIIIL